MEFAGNRAVVIKPKLSIRFAQIVVIVWYCPGAGRKNDARTHHPECAADGLAGSESIRANHNTHSPQIRLRHRQPIAARIKFLCEVELMNFTMVNEDLAGRIY